MTFYLVIGGPPQYHAEDDQFTEVYGLFSKLEDALQCYQFRIELSGSVVILPIEADTYFNPKDISLYGQDDYPPIKITAEAYQLVYVVTEYYFDRETDTMVHRVYKVCSDLIEAQKYLKSLIDAGADSWDCKIRAYCRFELDEFSPSIKEFIDVETNPVTLTKYPFGSRWYDKSKID